MDGTDYFDVAASIRFLISLNAYADAEGLRVNAHQTNTHCLEQDSFKVPLTPQEDVAFHGFVDSVRRKICNGLSADLALGASDVEVGIIFGEDTALPAVPTVAQWVAVKVGRLDNAGVAERCALAFIMTRYIKVSILAGHQSKSYH